MNDTPSASVPDSRGQFYRNAANISVGCLFASWIFSFVLTKPLAALGATGRWIGVGLPVLLTLLAIIAGATALFGVKKYGKEGLLTKGLCGVLLPILLTLLAIPAFLKVREVSTEKRISALIAESAQKGAFMVDEITRLDSVVRGKEKEVLVKFSITTLEATEINMEQWNQQVVDQIKSQFDQTPFAPLRKTGVRIVYLYSDKNGKEFSRIAFDSERAEQKTP